MAPWLTQVQILGVAGFRMLIDSISTDDEVFNEVVVEKSQQIFEVRIHVGLCRDGSFQRVPMLRLAGPWRFDAARILYRTSGRCLRSFQTAPLPVDASALLPRALFQLT